MAEVRGTFSIVAADPAAGEVGVAVQSKYFAVGAVVPWARAGVGAVATQAAGVAAYGPRALAALERGLDPADALTQVLREDEERETRQLGVVSADGRPATMTGSSCLDWAGGVTGEHFAAQGNILAGEGVVEAMASAFEAAGGVLAERLQAALEAGQAAGGDRRGQQSAAMVVERAGAAEEARDGIDRVVDLRVDDHPQPIAELGRLLEIHGRWDVLRRASAHHAPGSHADGVAILRQGLSRYGDDAALLYDLACFESLAGMQEEALAHLRRSVELEAGFRESAREDPDLSALRNTSEFVRLTSG